ncbi:MAG: 2-phosphosulfolactate phosphatase, partial [Bradymonadaceae bacterium]
VAMVAARVLAPHSKLATTRWWHVTTLPAVLGVAEADEDDLYEAMDWLLEHLETLQETVFFAVADLLQLDVDLIFFDTTSTYFELDFEDDGELDDTEEGESGQEEDQVDQADAEDRQEKHALPPCFEMYVLIHGNKYKTVCFIEKGKTQPSKLRKSLMLVHIFQGHSPSLPEAHIHVVIDVIRAFTTSWIALERGARDVLLVGEIAEAFDLLAHYPDHLLVGERDAIKIEGFDLGNSPWEMSRAEVSGRGLIFTTTNGVRATLHALEHGEVLVTGYLSAAQTVAAIEELAQGVEDFRVNLIASHPTGDEDMACAEWIRTRLMGAPEMEHETIVARIRGSEAARKFLDLTRPEFEARDIDECTRQATAPVAMRVERRDGRPVIVALPVKA